MDPENITDITANLIDTAENEMKAIIKMLEKHLETLVEMRNKSLENNNDPIYRASLVACYNRTNATLKSLRS